MLYDLHFDAALEAVRTLAGIAGKRPDLVEPLGNLLSSGAAFVCDLDEEATEATGNRVLRYYPSERLRMIVAAVTEDREFIDTGHGGQSEVC